MALPQQGRTRAGIEAMPLRGDLNPSRGADGPSEGSRGEDGPSEGCRGADGSPAVGSRGEMKARERPSLGDRRAQALPALAARCASIEVRLVSPAWAEEESGL